jgi:hypothetical protein
LLLAYKKEPSLKLKLMLEEINQAFGHAKEAIMSAYNQALAEGHTPQDAKKLILSSVKNLSSRTIYYYLPAESKDKKMQELAFRRKSLQSCNVNGKDSSSLASQPNKNSPDDFIVQLSKELDSRKPTEEMYLISKLTEEFDNETDYVPGIQNADSILLSEVFADTISNKVQANLSTGRISQFRLYHDGINVTAVGDF